MVAYVDFFDLVNFSTCTAATEMISGGSADNQAGVRCRGAVGKAHMHGKIGALRMPGQRGRGDGEQVLLPQLAFVG